MSLVDEKPANLYPIALDVSLRPCVVIGAGPVGARKAEALIAAGAHVTIVSPDMSFDAFALHGLQQFIEGEFEPAQLDGAFLVIAATNDPEVNRAVAIAARERGILINQAASASVSSVDNDFMTMATVRRGDLLVAITTGGAGPTVAARLRDELEERFGPEWEPYTALLREMRDRAKTTISDSLQRADALRRLAAADGVRAALAAGNADAARTGGTVMPLLMVGLSHNTHAPVEVRERIAFTMPGALERALGFLRQALRDGEECLLLSTCNRTELYLSTAGDRSSAELTELLTTARRRAEPEEAGTVLPADLTRYIEEQRGHRATEHLFRVAAGLDSMVLGESDIVRQLKDAYTRANESGLCGPNLHATVHEALRIGKRARTETDLARGAFSIGHAAVQVAESIFGGLQGRTVLVLGAGKMSETTARHLAASGASTILVANRTFDRAARLAELLNGRAIRYEEFAAHLARTDIVIASTAAPHYVVGREMVEPTLKARRRGSPLFLIDIAVPRDIDPAVADLNDVFLYNIDDLQSLVDADRAERQQRGARAEALVHDEALNFAARQRTQQTAAPIVSGLRAKHQGIVAEEKDRLRNRQTWTPEQWSAIEAMLQSIENRTLHDPTTKIREYAAVGDPAADAKIETALELFGLTRETSESPEPETVPITVGVS